MSLFKPKDRDYITRGLLLLIGWWILGTPVSIFLIALAVGNANIGVLGVPLVLVSGVVGYYKYLSFGEREHRRENAKILELMVELGRLEREILRRRSKAE